MLNQSDLSIRFGNTIVEKETFLTKVFQSLHNLEAMKIKKLF